MENLSIHITGNPLSELISEEIHSLLTSKGLIDEKSVRNYIIRKKIKIAQIKKN